MIALILLALAAGSAPPTPPATAHAVKALNACSAVTIADVERAFGRTFGRGQEEVHGQDSTCDYVSGNGQVSITIQRLPAKVNLPLEIEALRRTIEGSSVRPAQGIGSAAFFLDVTNAGTQLHVIRGERDYLMISVLGLGQAAEVSAQAESLARSALGRL